MITLIIHLIILFRQLIIHPNYTCRPISNNLSYILITHIGLYLTTYTS